MHAKNRVFILLISTAWAAGDAHMNRPVVRKIFSPAIDDFANMASSLLPMIKRSPILSYAKNINLQMSVRVRS